MKSEGVDAWLRHWLKLQKRNKHPLVLKDRSDKPSDHPAPPHIKGKGKAKAQEVDSEDDEEMDDDADDSVSNPALPPAPPTDTGTNAEGDDHIKSLPKSPSSAAHNRISSRTFLTSLSDDKSYKKLLLLLKAADVSTEWLVSALTTCIYSWMSRMEISWRNHRQHGYRGNPLIATFPRLSLTGNRHRHSQSLRTGLAWTRSQRITITSHHMSR